MELTFIDAETTGLKPNYHEIIQLSWLRYDTDYRERIVTGNLYAQPAYPERIDPQAVKVNGYNREEWEKKGAITQADLSLIVYNMFKAGTIFAGWGVYFDKAMLEGLQTRHCRGWDWSYQVLDVRSLAIAAKLNGR